jgi:cytidine deaminase
VPTSTDLTYVRVTESGTAFSDLHAVVQAWQPIQRLWSMTFAQRAVLEGSTAPGVRRDRQAPSLPPAALAPVAPNSGRVGDHEQDSRDATDAELLRVAEAALERAYAPYSRIRVGAAVQTQSGLVYGGCNVENASSPVGLCAERSAIASAVATEGPQVRIARMAVVARSADGALRSSAPCGSCRQFIAELGSQSIVLYYHGSTALRRSSIADLLPDAFENPGST